MRRPAPVCIPPRKRPRTPLHQPRPPNTPLPPGAPHRPRPAAQQTPGVAAPARETGRAAPAADSLTQARTGSFASCPMRRAMGFTAEPHTPFSQAELTGVGVGEEVAGTSSPEIGVTAFARLPVRALLKLPSPRPAQTSTGNRQAGGAGGGQGQSREASFSSAA